VSAEIPAEAVDLLQAIYATLRRSDDRAAERVATALVPVMGRIRCHLPVRADDLPNAAGILTEHSDRPMGRRRDRAGARRDAAHLGRPTWGGPTVATAVGVDLPACTFCRRYVAHSWAEHVALVGDSIDPLAKAAGLKVGDAA
jgi:hypothetical protein